jgi:hypothetical protein
VKLIDFAKQNEKIYIILISVVLATSTNAQIKLDDILGQVTDLLGKKELLSVKKGFSPKFSLGKLQLNKVGILGEQLKGIKVLGTIFNGKGAKDITKLYKTYKTGLVVYKILAGAGTVVSTYTAVRGAVGEEKFNNQTVKQLLVPALTTLVTGVVTKLLTKKASYKAVDIFNGVVKKKVKDIFNIGASSQGVGVGLYVKL